MEKEFYYSKDGTKVMVVAPMEELESIIDRMDRFKYQYDHMLIIGNGFDLNLGLPTTYRNFIESFTFKRIYEKHLQEKRLQTKPQPSLLDFLYGKKFIEKWYDIESALLEYVSKRPDGSFVNNIQEDKKDYYTLCNCLIAYLLELFQKDSISAKQANLMSESAAGKILRILKSDRNIVYSFNYTPIQIITRIATFIEKENTRAEIVRQHDAIKEESFIKGKAKNENIILGIETSDISRIAPGYSFLMKSNNPKYKSTTIAYDLLNTRNVIFFGHSLNQMDFGYFKEYFELLASNTDKGRILTLVTKDKDSRIELLDNLRKAGISVRDIYTHITVETILTDELNKTNSESRNNFDNLLRRIDEEYYRNH